MENGDEENAAKYFIKWIELYKETFQDDRVGFRKFDALDWKVWINSYLAHYYIQNKNFERGKKIIQEIEEIMVKSDLWIEHDNPDEIPFIDLDHTLYINYHLSIAYKGLKNDTKSINHLNRAYENMNKIGDRMNDKDYQMYLGKLICKKILDSKNNI